MGDAGIGSYICTVPVNIIDFFGARMQASFSFDTCFALLLEEVVTRRGCDFLMTRGEPLRPRLAWTELLGRLRRSFWATRFDCHEERRSLSGSSVPGEPGRRWLRPGITRSVIEYTETISTAPGCGPPSAAKWSAPPVAARAAARRWRCTSPACRDLLAPRPSPRAAGTWPSISWLAVGLALT